MDTAHSAFKGRYGKGYLPVPDHVQKTSSRALLGAPVRLPDAWDGLSQHVAAIHSQLDQKSTNMCVGFSLAVNIYLSLAALGIHITLPSMPAIYWAARASLRSPGEPLVDLGCSPDAAVIGIGEWGVPPVTAWPFDPATVNDEPDAGVLEGMRDLRVPGHYYIDGLGPEAVLDAKNVLSRNIPISVGMLTDKAFEDWWYDPSDPHPVTAPVEAEVLGGHMPLIVGYETRANYDTWFKVLNWWGDWGGMGGYFWADEEWFKRTTDRSVLTVARGARRAP